LSGRNRKALDRGRTQTPSEPPSPSDPALRQQLDSALAEATSEVRALQQSFLDRLDNGIEDAVKPMGEFVGTILDQMEDDLADAEVTIEDAQRKAYDALNREILNVGIAAHYAGADVDLSGFPGGIPPPPMAKPTRGSQTSRSILTTNPVVPTLGKPPIDVIGSPPIATLPVVPPLLPIHGPPQEPRPPIGVVPQEPRPPLKPVPPPPVKPPGKPDCPPDKIVPVPLPYPFPVQTIVPGPQQPPQVIYVPIHGNPTKPSDGPSSSCPPPVINIQTAACPASPPVNVVVNPPAVPGQQIVVNPPGQRPPRPQRPPDVDVDFSLSIPVSLQAGPSIDFFPLAATQPINIQLATGGTPPEKAGRPPVRLDDRLQVDPVVGGSEWDQSFGRCRDLEIIKEEIVKLGKQLIKDASEAKHFDAYHLVAVVKLAYPKTKEEEDGSIRWVNFINQLLKGSPAYRELLRVANLPFTGNRQGHEDRIALHVAADWLIALREVTVKITRNHRGGWIDNEVSGQNLGIGTPLAGLVGSGLATESGAQVIRNEAYDWTREVALQVRPIVIVMASLAQWFRDNDQQPTLPTMEGLTAAYVRGAMEKGDYECWIGLHGGMRDTWFRQAYASRTMLSSHDYIAARHRGLLSDNGYTQFMRELGYLDPTDVRLALDLSKVLPPVGDIIRFMVRDVFDRGIVERFQLDKEFGDKFRGDLPSWARSQGLDVPVVQAYWRAHWQNPGLNQAYEVFHRFPEDSPEAQRLGVVTTIDDIRALLAQDDVAPFWRDRLIAISYSPLTRVDSQRMFMTGVIDREALVWAFRALSYDRTNAERLAEFTQRRRDESLVRSKPARLYVRGTIGRKETLARLARFKLRTDEINELFALLDAEVRAATINVCIKAVKAQYLRGSWSDQDTHAELITRGVPPDHATQILARFKCEKASKDKVIPASQLCTWFAQGLINEADFKLRLIRLNYSAAEAEVIVKSCDEGKRIPLAKKRARETEAERKRVAKIAATAEREKELAASKAARAERALEREAAAEARRKAKLRKAAESIAGGEDLTLEGAADAIMNEVAFLIADYGLTQAEAEGILIDAVKRYSPSQGETLHNAVVALAEAEEEFDRGVI